VGFIESVTEETWSKLQDQLMTDVTHSTYNNHYHW